MKAALYDRHGAAREVLRVEDVARPEPGPGEVRVKVELSGINPTDWKSRSGATPRPIDGFQIPHHDGAGVIDAVGEDVDPAASASEYGSGWPRTAARGGPPPSGPLSRSRWRSRCLRGLRPSSAPAWASPQ